MRNFSPLSIGNSSSCITAVEWEAYDVQNTAGNARRYHSRRQNSSCFHPGNRAEVFIWKIFQSAYRDPYEHIQDLEVRWNLETDSVLSTGFMWRRSKAWFPHHRPDRSDNPSRFKKFSRRSGRRTICGFHLIVSIASTTKDAGSSAMSLGQTIEFLRVFYK